MYSQLPDYGELQGYDLGVESALCQIAQKVYPSYRNPSWETLKRHLVMAKIPKKLFRELKILARNDKTRFQTRKNVPNGCQNPNC